jgi:hypothetical protein
MRKVAFTLAFLIFSIPAIVEAPYTPIWNAGKYESIIELKTMGIAGKREFAERQAHITFLRLKEAIDRAEKAEDKDEQAEELRLADYLQHVGYQHYLNSLRDFEKKFFYYKHLTPRDI